MGAAIYDKKNMLKLFFNKLTFIVSNHALIPQPNGGTIFEHPMNMSFETFLKSVSRIVSEISDDKINKFL